MEEPSLLDYLKSRLRFWKHAAMIPPQKTAEETMPSAVQESVDSSREEETSQKPTLQVIETGTRKTVFPWRSLLGLVFILVAQRLFEPSPGRNATSGLVLYAIGLTCVLLASLKGEWTASEASRTGGDRQESDGKSSQYRIKVLPFILTILFSLAAFLAFKNNQFTIVNVTLWLLGLLCFFWAFWIPQKSGHRKTNRIGSFLHRDTWKASINPQSILILFVIILVLFFRLYQINTVPSEPISDHAEKILDVYDVTQGYTSIFFPRNTGREAIQMYLTVAVSWLFGTGLSFLSLKIGTVLCGLLTLPYMYMLGRSLGGRWVALLAVLFAGIAYWPNVISRIGLRFPLYPLFVAPTLYYLLRGLRTNNRNDFILAGIALGLGLHGYSPIRILPLVVIVAVVLFLFHKASRNNRKQTIQNMVLLIVSSIIIFLPLLRYWMENPGLFAYRAFSRLGSLETELPGPVGTVFFSNLWNALKMFNWDDGQIWVHSVTHRPALDIVTGAFFVVGIVLLLVRYIKRRNWVDLFLLLSIPLLQLPSILSLAYPAENPALNRAGGAIVPVFLVVAVVFEGFFSGIRTRLAGRGGAILVGSLAGLLIIWSCWQNYDLVFHKFSEQYDRAAWNTSEMGLVIKQFMASDEPSDQVWIIPYAHWVDTRLPGIWAGIPNRDFAVWPENLETTLQLPLPKLFIVNQQDEVARDRLEELYPTGMWSRYNSRTGIPEKDFLIYFISPQETR